MFLVGQGVIQNFDAYKDVTLLEATNYQQPKIGADGQPLKDAKGNPVMEDATTDTQTLAMGPVASQEAIKMLGTNGGGFFNANSAHPVREPDRAVQLRADAGDLPDPGRAVLHLRPRWSATCARAGRCWRP